MKKSNCELDLGRVDYSRKYRIGTQFMTSNREVFKYVKIDLGSAGKIDGKTMRIIIYRWIQWRQL